METKYAKSAYRTFLFWGICSSLGITISTLIDATLVGNFIGSEGLAIANIATPVFLIYALLGITLGSGANVLIGKFLGASDIEKANANFKYVLSIGLIVGIVLSIISLIFCASSAEIFFPPRKAVRKFGREPPNVRSTK